MVCLCSLYTEQSINYFGYKLTFFFKSNKFQPLKFFLEILVYRPTWFKYRHGFQLRTEVFLYKAVDTKSPLKFKAFSLGTEVIERE